MIKIEFSLAIALYIIFTLCFIFASWAVFDKKRNASDLFLSEKEFFWQCATCTYVYVDTTHNAISSCPRCGSYNKKSDEDITYEKQRFS